MNNHHASSLDNPDRMTTAEIGRILEIIYEGRMTPAVEHWSYVYEKRVEQDRRLKRGQR